MRPIDADELLNLIEKGLRENPHKDGRIRANHTTEYMHFRDMVCRMPTVSQPPNTPLTMDELREMEGMPVYITTQKHGNGWCIVDWHGVNKSWMYFSRTGTAEGMTAIPVSAKDYGDKWLAYRQKPQENAP